MTDREQEPGDLPPSDEFVPGEDEFEEEEEDQEASVQPSKRSRAAEPEEGGHRFFGLFGRKKQAAEADAGSVRGTHAERVHIDDRASALFAIVCALALVGIPIVSFAILHLPKAAVKPLGTLSVPTYNGSALPSGSLVVTPSPVPSATAPPAPTATPTPAPTTPAPSASTK